MGQMKLLAKFLLVSDLSIKYAYTQFKRNY